MDPEGWRRVRELFETLLGLPREARLASLARRAAGDPQLHREVESLLAAHAAAGGFLSRPVAQLAVPADAAPAAHGDRRIGAYRVLGPLGAGGMGEVYLAERADGAYERRVAIKLLRGAGSAELVTRFRAERRILAALDHPGIARLIDAGSTDEGRPYLILEHVEGSPIDRYAEDLPLDARLKLFTGVCRAVEAAHRAGVVHRDLKPSNILVAATGEPKLLDFGIAKLLPGWSTPGSATTTPRGATPMTPPYASPEQLRGGVVGPASDVYSLGLLLYELSTGRSPYRLRGADAEALVRAICEEEPPRPSAAAGKEAGFAAPVGPPPGLAPAALRRRLAGDLDAIVLQALHKEADRRYHDAGQLADDLERAACGEPVAARRWTVIYRARRLLRRRRRAVAGGVAAALLLSLAAAAMVASQHQRHRAATAAGLAGELLQLSAPADRGNQPVDVERLEAGVQAVERRLGGEPTLRADLLETAGHLYGELGRYRAASELLGEVRELRTQLYGQRHPKTAATLHQLGVVETLLGRYAPAERHLTTALALRRQTLGADDRNTLETLRQLARTRRLGGDPGGADPLAKEALRRSQARFGVRSEGTVWALQEWAQSQMALGDYRAAEGLFHRALALHRQIDDGPHPSTAEALDGLANLLTMLGETRQAEPLARRALKTYETLYGQRHPLALDSLANVATLRWRSGDPRAAEELYRRVLDAADGVLPPDHDTRIATLNNLALTLAVRRGPVAAIDLLRQAAAAIRRKHPHGHPDLAVSLSNLGYFLTDIGRYREAQEVTEEALEIYRSCCGGHPNVGVAYRNLARIELALGQLSRARGHFAAAREIFRRQLGEDHPRVAETLLGLAATDLSAGEVGAAGALIDRALELLDRHPGGGRLERLMALVAKTRLCLEERDASRAEAFARHALEGSPLGIWGGQIRLLLGQSLVAQGRAGEAEPYLLAARQLLCERLGSGAPACREADDVLATATAPRRTPRDGPHAGPATAD